MDVKGRKAVAAQEESVESDQHNKASRDDPQSEFQTDAVLEHLSSRPKMYRSRMILADVAAPVSARSRRPSERPVKSDFKLDSRWQSTHASLESRGLCWNLAELNSPHNLVLKRHRRDNLPLMVDK